MEKIRVQGLSLENLGCIASCNGLKVELCWGNSDKKGKKESTSFEVFKEHIRKAS
jgi:hypothetical protein